MMFIELVHVFKMYVFHIQHTLVYEKEREMSTQKNKEKIRSKEEEERNLTAGK